MNNETNFSEIAEYIEKLQKPELIELRDDLGKKITSVLVHPKELKTTDVAEILEPYMHHPHHRTGTAIHHASTSFIKHAIRFKDEGSVIFVDAKSSPPTMTSVLDYHPEGAESNPRFGRHRGIYTLKHSKEWNAWCENNAKRMSQQDFAEFLENHLPDIYYTADISSLDQKLQDFCKLTGGSFATPTKLLELSRGLNVSCNEKVKSATNLQTGEVAIQYISEHTGETGQPLKVPNLFMIAIPVFEGDAVYQIAIRLRYRLSGGTVCWFYEMLLTQQVKDHALKQSIDFVGSETGLPVFLGIPE